VTASYETPGVRIYREGSIGSKR